MSDPRSQQADQPSQEELDAYLEQLRDADPGELLAQAYTMLGTGVEVKLGRPDARVLIDAMAALTESLAGKVGEDLVTRMRNGVVQLQAAQVQAEGAVGAAAPRDDVPPGQPRMSEPPTPEPPASPASDRLWIPGRDAR